MNLSIPRGQCLIGSACACDGCNKDGSVVVFLRAIN